MRVTGAPYLSQAGGAGHSSGRPVVGVIGKDSELVCESSVREVKLISYRLPHLDA